MINLESWLERNLYGAGVNTFAFRKPISWLIVFSLILPGCSTTSVPVNQYKIKPETIALLEKNQDFKRLLDLVRAVGKTIQITDGLEFADAGSTQVIIPYDLTDGRRNFLEAELKGGTVGDLALSRTVKDSSGQLTTTAADAITGSAVTAVGTVDANGKATVSSYQVGTVSSNATLEGMLTVAEVRPQQNCQTEKENVATAALTQIASINAMIYFCGFGLLVFTPDCWLAAGFAVAATFTLLALNNQLRRCQGQNT